MSEIVMDPEALVKEFQRQEQARNELEAEQRRNVRARGVKERRAKRKASKIAKRRNRG